MFSERIEIWPYVLLAKSLKEVLCHGGVAVQGRVEQMRESDVDHETLGS